MTRFCRINKDLSETHCHGSISVLPKIFTTKIYHRTVNAFVKLTNTEVT
jgi:hypothetical protein